MSELVNPRSQFVKTRLLEINKQAGNLIIENGVLLREYAVDCHWRQEGYASFEQAIDAMHDAGQLDYKSRNARNFIAIVNMFDKLGVDPAATSALGMSKLREIAALGEADQTKLLEAAPDMTVAEVTAEAKRIRDKAAGRDTDPLVAIPFKLSTTQKTFFDECLVEARTIYALEDNVPDAAVLVDAILPEWFNTRETHT